MLNYSSQHSLIASEKKPKQTTKQVSEPQSIVYLLRKFLIHDFWNLKVCVVSWYALTLCSLLLVNVLISYQASLGTSGITMLENFTYLAGGIC